MRQPSVLIVGHGTRDRRGVDGFWEIVRRAAKLARGTPLEGCFLELVEPGIDEGVARLVRRGVRRIAVAPLLLFAAAHVRRDIPAAVRRAAARHGGVETFQVPHLGCHPRIVDLSRRRFDEALAGRPTVPPDQTLLVLAARGSRDSRAVREAGEFADLRGTGAPIAQVETCFLAMARPSLAEMLPRAGRSPFRRMVVQPHLLLPGALWDQVRGAVDEAARRFPSKEWIVPDPLGPDRAVAETVVDRVAGWGGTDELAPAGSRKVG